MEYFDLVNEKDEVIGTTTKPISHNERKIHRIVAIYVFDSQNRLFVQDHLKDKKYDHSVGGHVHKGESYDKAATREAYEELGIVDSLTKLGNFYQGYPKSMHMVGLYECKPSLSWKFISNSEVDRIIPMTLVDVVKEMNNNPRKFIGDFRFTMSQYIKIKKLPFLLKDNV